jgi:hypothetical protein
MARKKPVLPFVRSITSNLKSPHEDGSPWTVELGQKTLIVGDNTSHKSAVLQAVELALTGAADDIVGRFDVKDPSLLLTLSPGDNLTSLAHFSADGITPATYSVERSGDRVKKPTHSVGFDSKRVMPHRLVKAAVAGSEKTARKAFLEWTADEVSLQDVLGKLSTDFHARYQDLIEKIAVDKNAVEQLLSVMDYAGKQQRDAAKEVKGAESALSSMSGSLPDKPTDEELEAAELAIGEAQKIYDDAVQAFTSPTNDEIELQYSSVEESAQHLVNSLNAIRQKHNTMMDPARIAEISARLFEWASKNETDTCPACNHGHGKDHNQVLFDHWRTTWEQERKRVEKQSLRLEDEFSQLQQTFQAQRKRLEELQALRGTGREAGEDTLSMEEAQAQLDKASADFSNLASSVESWSKLSEMQDVINTMSLEADRNKLFKAACEEAVGQLLEDQAERFSDVVSTYLPDDWTFGIDLKDGSREVFRMGIRRNDKLHCALSGAESAAVVSAIAMATVNGTNEPRVIIPEDRAWDTATLGSVMRSLSSFPGQVIMASTVRPKGRKPAGWTIIEADSFFEGEVTQLVPSPDVEEVVDDSSGVSIRSAQILEGMGYEVDDVQRMTSETAADLIRQGLSAAQVTITKSGKYRVAKQGTVLPMPPNK